MRYGSWSIVLVGLLSACGGGGTSQPTPTPSGNAPPSFTSASAATVAENSAGVIYQATASDREGNPLTFSLVGGADQARFAITRRARFRS